MWMARGKSYWEIEKLLGLSENTVKFHAKNILKKLNATSRTVAVAKTICDGVIRMDNS